MGVTWVLVVKTSSISSYTKNDLTDPPYQNPSKDPLAKAIIKAPHFKPLPFRTPDKKKDLKPQSPEAQNLGSLYPVGFVLFGV